MQQETPQQIVLQQVSKWFDELNLTDSSAEIHLNVGSRINAEEGILSQAFVIRIDRKMEKVTEQPTLKQDDTNQ
jgi:hypothetical protein